MSSIRSMAIDERTIHFVVGESPAEVLREALPEATIVTTHGDFIEGPCRFAGGRESTETPGAWLQKRCDWWGAQWDPSGGYTAAAVAAQRESAGKLESVLQLVPKCGATIWVGDFCGDQLHLAWLLSVFRTQFGGAAKVWLARPVAPKGFQNPWPVAVGWCNPDELMAAKVSMVSAHLTDTAIGVWSGFVDENPRRFASLVRTQTTLSPSLCRILQRFPDIRDGLDFFERRLLARTLAHPDEGSMRTLGHVVVSDDLQSVSIRTLFQRFRELAQQGLFTLVGDGETMWTSDYQATELGARVLEGTANRTRACGIDRWIGGTHLRPGEPIWWYDASSMTLVQD